MYEIFIPSFNRHGDFLPLRYQHDTVYECCKSIEYIKNEPYFDVLGYELIDLEDNVLVSKRIYTDTYDKFFLKGSFALEDFEPDLGLKTRSRQSENGVALIEYIILIGFVSMALMFAMISFKNKIETTFSTIGSALVTNNEGDCQ